MGKVRVAIVDVAGGGTVYAYQNDRLGTPELLTTGVGDNETVAWEAWYEPFGEAHIHPSSSVVNDIRLPGQYFDQETGMHYNWHRYYDPRTGRYITPDPAGQLGGINLYLYVENNPINFVDANGLWGFGVIGSGSAEVGLIAIGAGATGSLGGGVFGGGSRGLSLGGFASAGAFAGGPGYAVSYPSPCEETTLVGGAFAAAGVGGFLTNATTASELRGPFDTYSFNVGVGPFKVSVQFGTGNGIWIGSATFGPGAGISGSRYPMNTWATR